MSRKPSPATQVRTYKRIHREAVQEAASLRQQLRVEQGKATKAAQECAEWKRRFDTLLQHGFKVPDPEVKVPTNGDLETRVREMVGGNRDTGLYVNAIKLVRNDTGCSLKAAKDYVDQFRQVQAA